MARQLSKKQIKILETIYNETQATTWDDIPLENRDTLKNANDYETLWSDAERWLIDRYFTIGVTN